MQSFISAATGMAIVVPLARSFARARSETVGNIWGREGRGGRNREVHPVSAGLPSVPRSVKLGLELSKYHVPVRDHLSQGLLEQHEGCLAEIAGAWAAVLARVSSGSKSTAADLPPFSLTGPSATALRRLIESV